jgi:hypothetical protein
MADFMGMMKQAAQLQTKLQEVQAELEQIEVEGSAGGGLVAVRLSEGRAQGRYDRRLAAQAGGEGDHRRPACHRACGRAPQGGRRDAGQDEEPHRWAAAATRSQAVLIRTASTQET